MKLKQKHIDAFRETRLWLGQVIIPMGIAIAYLNSNEELKKNIVNTCGKVKNKVQNLIKH